MAGQSDGSHLFCRLAALIDGEGMIAVEKTQPSPRLQNRTNPRYQSYVRIVNTNEVLMRWLVEHFGGSYRSRKPEKPHHKPPHTWTVADKDARNILVKVRPFLIIKTAQCDNNLAFTAGYEDSRGRHAGRGRGMRPEELARRERHYLVSRSLNRRGVAPAETKRGSAV